MMGRDRQSRVSYLGPIRASKIGLKAKQAFGPCWHSDLEIVLGVEWECGGCPKTRRYSRYLW